MPDSDTAIPPGDIHLRDVGPLATADLAPTLQAAIDAAHAAGGGRVVVPAGRWVCGTVRLRSCVELHLGNGAVLVQGHDPALYPRERDDNMPPHLDRKHAGLGSMIVAKDCEDVAITGPGTIDADTADGAPRAYFVLGLFRCRGLRIEGISIRNAKGWTVLCSCCDEVLIRGVRMRNPLTTGDGFDIDGCRDVRISDCDIVTGDDCIVIKTCKTTRSAERITISNCILRTSCAAMKIGTETWHDVRHVTMANCVVHRSGRAVQLFSMDGATVEDVVVTGLSVDTDSGIIFNRAIHIDCCRRFAGFQAAAPGQEPPAGRIRRVSISDVNIVSDGRILLTGTDRPLEQISLRNIRMTVPWIEDPQRVAHTGDQMQCSNGCPEERLARAALVATGIEDFELSNFSLRWPDGPPPADFAVKCELGEPQIDPHHDTEPPPPFHALRLRRVTGRIEREGLSGSQPDLPAIDEE